MLRTNSKKARENLREYIRNIYDGTNYENAPEDNAPFEQIAAFILNTYESEKYRNRGNKQDLFVEWCSGLPSVIDTCYYYNRSAVDDLGAILEETETEKARFDESAAENMLSRLIYMELVRAA